MSAMLHMLWIRYCQLEAELDLALKNIEAILDQKGSKPTPRDETQATLKRGRSMSPVQYLPLPQDVVGKKELKQLFE